MNQHFAAPSCGIVASAFTARWRGGAGSSPLDAASSSPRNDLHATHCSIYAQVQNMQQERSRLGPDRAPAPAAPGPAPGAARPPEDAAAKERERDKARAAAGAAPPLPLDEAKRGDSDPRTGRRAQTGSSAPAADRPRGAAPPPAAAAPRRTAAAVDDSAPPTTAASATRPGGGR
jgi:hypothetical protein